ncbi:hypothetical protein L484_008487 [Morus notabilis]|uniref:Ubiquitin-like domain-containing protein n=1 Tax=Morus notabilis TaxID=981085 RepID=W9S746_9ROSA|nr:hypothetical protein L484_008487 [Morus notabilis]
MGTLRVRTMEISAVDYTNENALQLCSSFLFEVEVVAMYIRVKRNKTTYFIQCEPTETVLDIKQKLHVLIDQPVNDQCLTLMNDGQTGQVENDAVVALTLRKDDNEFEEVNIVRPSDFYQSREGDGGNW